MGRQQDEIDRFSVSNPHPEQRLWGTPLLGMRGEREVKRGQSPLHHVVAPDQKIGLLEASVIPFQLARIWSFTFAGIGTYSRSTASLSPFL